MIPWATCTKALAEYRQHNYESAIQHCRQCLAHDNANALWYGHLAHFILAMSLTKTDQVEEARGSLDQGIQELRGREPDYATDPTRNGWHDLLICQFLAAEATALVKQAEASQDTPDQLRRQAASSDSLSGEGE